MQFATKYSVALVTCKNLFMAKSKETFAKREREKKRQQHKQAKRQKKEERRKANANKEKNPDDMIAYIDEYGNLTSTPPAHK
jgi:hypothetical protein